MNILCTICARKGSKEIKNKNIIPFNGKPLIYHTINQARKLNIFDKIVCSSDSRKILNIAKKNNVDFLIQREKKLSTNKIPKIDVIRQALILSEKKFKKKFNYIIDLDVTSPLRSMADIKNSLNFIKKTTTDCNLITICPSRKNPYFNMVEIDKTKKIKIIKSIQKKIISARQSAPKVFEVNAGIYIWKRSFLINNNKLINSHTRYFVTPYERSIDIDSKIDLKIAEFLFKNKKYR
jgi:CMP-N,N'-diacetyllegionaminic acid synthase